MTTEPRRPSWMHLPPQSAKSLLGTVVGDLATVEARLVQYVERVRMPDADRETMARALEIVARARREAADLE